MKVILVACVVFSCSVSYGQFPPGSGWGYYNKAEALRQQQWENEYRLRQQEAWERANPARNPTLEWAEQATRIRANKEQERYYRNLNRKMERSSGGLENPFSQNPFYR